MNKRLIHLIGNPIAGGSALKRIHKAEQLLSQYGETVQIHMTKKAGDAETYARQIAANTSPSAAQLIIAAGGDGTFNEVANGLAGSSVAMAILPFGTTSVLAREIGVPLNDMEAAIHYALHEESRPISLGRIVLENGYHRLFLLMAGIGFDGEIVHNVKPALKRLIGKGAYALSTICSIFCYKPQQLRLTLTLEDGSIIETQGTSVIVSNASRYGGDYVITPNASLTTRSLEIMIDHSCRPSDFMKVLIAIGRQKKIPEALYATVTSLRIDGSSHIQVDGDESGTTPAVIDVVPESLRLVMKA